MNRQLQNIANSKANMVPTYYAWNFYCLVAAVFKLSPPTP